jgi:hypothetical protein
VIIICSLIACVYRKKACFGGVTPGDRYERVSLDDIYRPDDSEYGLDDRLHTMETVRLPPYPRGGIYVACPLWNTCVAAMSPPQLVSLTVWPPCTPVCQGQGDPGGFHEPLPVGMSVASVMEDPSQQEDFREACELRGYQAYFNAAEGMADYNRCSEVCAADIPATTQCSPSLIHTSLTPPPHSCVYRRSCQCGRGASGRSIWYRIPHRGFISTQRPSIRSKMP